MRAAGDDVRAAGDDVRAVKAALSDPVDVCRRLGLMDRAQRAGGGLLVCCPVHGDRHPSCSVHRAPDRTLAARCWACGWTGDVLSLLAAVEGLDARRDFRDVVRRAAELGHVDVTAPAPRRELPPLPPREPPPAGEVEALLVRGGVPARSAPCAAWLRSRALDPAACSALARVIPRRLPPWARYRGDAVEARWWSDTGHLLVMPVYDIAGQRRSVRARLVTGGDATKSLPPSGCSIAGLVLANRGAVEMLRAGPAGHRARVVVAEGEPDYLTWASRLSWACWAVLGLPGSGAWTRELADRIPSGSEVIVRTDPDAAGDRYADRVREDLGGRCVLRVSHAESRRARAACGCRGCVLHGWRSPEPCGRPKGEDDNALLMAGRLGADPREGTEKA